MAARVVVVDVELEHRGVGSVDQHRDRFLEVHAGQTGDEHTLSAGRLLDDTLDLAEERTTKVDNGFQDRIGDRLSRPGGREAVFDGDDVGGVGQVGPLVGLRVAGLPQVHAHVHAVRLGHVLDDRADLLHAHRAGHHHGGVLEDVGAHHVDRGLQRGQERLDALAFVLQCLQQRPEPCPHVGVEGAGLVDELPDPRLQPHRLLGDHRLQATDDGADEHGVRDRLGLDGQPPRRQDVDVVQDVEDAKAIGGEGAFPALVGVLGVVDEPGPPHRPDLDGDTDQLFAATP